MARSSALLGNSGFQCNFSRVSLEDARGGRSKIIRAASFILMHLQVIHQCRVSSVAPDNVFIIQCVVKKAIEKVNLAIRGKYALIRLRRPSFLLIANVFNVIIQLQVRMH